MLQTGDSAPAFSLPDADMEIVNLEDFVGEKNVVLYFYPKDDTPGCTQEAVEFSGLDQEFENLDAVVFGISRDDCISHADFRDKHGLTVRLLADTDGEVCEQYDVWREKEKDGHKSMGILRSTFIIDKQGVIRDAEYGVSVQGHARDVMQRLGGLVA